MVRLTGLDLGLLALSRLDGGASAPRPAEAEGGELVLRRLDPELARLYLPPGRLASEPAPGGTMGARRVELARGEDLVSLGPAFSLDRMALLGLELQARPQPQAERETPSVVDASALMESTTHGLRARRASEAYRAMQPEGGSKRER